MSLVATPADRFALVGSAQRPVLLSGIWPHVRVWLRVLAVLMSPVAAWAQEQPPRAHKESQWGVGLGLGSVRKPYKDSDDEAIGLPLLLHESRWVSISGPTFDLKIPSRSALSFRLRARYEPGIGYEAADSPALAGMDERKAGVWLGAAAVWRTEIVEVGAEWLADASGYSEGQRATLSLQRRFPFGSISVTPRAEVLWLDRKNVNYYYGVSAQETLASRPVFEAGSTVNARLGIRLDYRPVARHALFLDLNTTQLGTDIEDSPIVGRSASSSAFLGYVYMFQASQPH